MSWTVRAPQQPMRQRFASHASRSATACGNGNGTRGLKAGPVFIADVPAGTNWADKVQSELVHGS